MSLTEDVTLEFLELADRIGIAHPEIYISEISNQNASILKPTFATINKYLENNPEFRKDQLAFQVGMVIGESIGPILNTEKWIEQQTKRYQ